MTYPFAQSVQWVARSDNSTGSGYRGTNRTDADPVTVQAVFAPGGSAELTDGGDVVTTQPTLYGVDPSLGVSALDRFQIGSDVYEVDGDPQQGFQSPFTNWRPGQVVNLRRVSGVG